MAAAKIKDILWKPDLGRVSMGDHGCIDTNAWVSYAFDTEPDETYYTWYHELKEGKWKLSLQQPILNHEFKYFLERNREADERFKRDVDRARRERDEFKKRESRRMRILQRELNPPSGRFYRLAEEAVDSDIAEESRNS